MYILILDRKDQGCYFEIISKNILQILNVIHYASRNWPLFPNPINGKLQSHFVVNIWRGSDTIDGEFL